MMSQKTSFDANDQVISQAELEKDVVRSQGEDSQGEDSQGEDSQGQDSQGQDSQVENSQVENFLSLENQNLTTPLSNNLLGEPQREPVKHLLIGSPKTVNSTIYFLKKLGYADVNDWSPIQPTSNPEEVMAILVRYLVVQ